MCIETRRDRHSHATTRRTMTGRTTDSAHVEMACVVKLHAETPQPRERLRHSRLHISMADGADRTFGIGKLLRMTAGTGQVTGTARPFGNGGVRLAPVTQETGQSRMVAAAVEKFCVVQSLRKLHLVLRRPRTLCHLYVALCLRSGTVAKNTYHGDTEEQSDQTERYGLKHAGHSRQFVWQMSHELGFFGTGGGIAAA